MLLGYWKRIIYLMDIEDALAVAHTFGNFSTFRSLSLGDQASLNNTLPNFDGLSYSNKDT